MPQFKIRLAQYICVCHIKLCKNICRVWYFSNQTTILVTWLSLLQWDAGWVSVKSV